MPERWPNQPATTTAEEGSRSQVPSQVPNAASIRREEQATESTYIPESTYEIFQQIFSVDRLSTSTGLHSRTDSDSILTEETGALLRLYQNGIGEWMDVFDHSHTYKNDVVMYSLSSPLLMHAVCALPAKQMSLVDNKFLWEPVSSRFYGKSLSLLIKELTEQSTDSQLVLAATIMLGSYELLTQPGIDYQRHLYGAHTLILSRNIREDGTLFEKASFWIYARQDVALALVNERPTLTPPAKWPAITADAAPVEEWFGKRILWLLARVIEAKFTAKIEKWSRAELGKFESLVSEIDLSWAALPSHVRGVHMKHTFFEEEGLSRVWFHVPSACKPKRIVLRPSVANTISGCVSILPYGQDPSLRMFPGEAFRRFLTRRTGREDDGLNSSSCSCDRVDLLVF